MRYRIYDQILAFMSGMFMLQSAWGLDAAAFWREQIEVPFDVTVLEADEDDTLSWQSMVYTSEIYHGEPMRIFAFYVRPKASGVYPAVLSIHGGGGRADLQRARAFAQAGYACLSFTWHACGDPVRPAWTPGDPPPSGHYTQYGNMRYTDWGRHFSQHQRDWKEPILYRAIMAARRGLTWLAEQPEVDGTRLAVEGHSWGGFLTQLLIGVDDRPKAAVASVSAGAWIGRYVEGNEGHIAHLTPWQVFEWSRRYDPAAFAANIETPLLVRLPVADFFGSVDALADYWHSISAPKSLELQASGNHGFGDVERRITWFNHIMQDAPAFPEVADFSVERVPGSSEWIVRARGRSETELQRAIVAWTTSPKPWSQRVWPQIEMKREGEGDGWHGVISPVNAGGPLRVFASVQDENGVVASVMPKILPLPVPAEVPKIVRESALDVKMFDGDTPDWAAVPVIGPAAQGPEALGAMSFSVQASWNDEALHLRLIVDDLTPWLPTASHHFWNGDSIQIRFRTDERHADGRVDVDEQRVLHLAFYPDPGDPEVVTSHAVRHRDFRDEVADLSPLHAAVEVAAASYTVSMRLPWAFIDESFTPKPGRTFRMGFIVNYADILTAERVSWVDFNGAGAFNNPQQWGTATLVD